MQLLLVASMPTRVQLGEPKPPGPSPVKATLPAGAEAAPEPAVSSTVAVQVLPWPTTTGVAQVTIVEVER